MANPKEAQRITSADVGAAPAADSTAGWVDIQDHRPMWLADEMSQHCICDVPRRELSKIGKAPHVDGCPSQVRGYMLGTMEMNPSAKNIKEDRPMEEQYWVGVIFQLTQKTKARSAEKDIREFDPGTQIIVGGKDLVSLYARADNRTLAFEAIVWPTKKLDLGGRKMWLLHKKVNPTPLDREKHGLLFYEGRTAMIDADPFNGATALPSGNGPGNGVPALTQCVPHGAGAGAGVAVAGASQ
jgi:hypothetical protein